MTSAVGAERRIVNAARIIGRMAVGAAIIKGLVVHADPVFVHVRLRLWTTAYLEVGDEIERSRHNRYGMTYIAFQPDSFLFRIEVLPIVAAKTTRRIFMPDVIRVRRPIRVLFRKDTLLVGVL